MKSPQAGDTRWMGSSSILKFRLNHFSFFLLSLFMNKFSFIMDIILLDVVLDGLHLNLFLNTFIMLYQSILFSFASYSKCLLDSLLVVMP